MHRANEAISRAEYAETRLKDAFERLTEAEEARSQSEIHSIKVEEDLHRYREQATRVQQESRDARIQIESLRQEKSASEREVEKIRVANLELQSKFRSYQAKEQGREEGLKSGMLKQFHENRQYIWEAGFSDGFEEGREAGFEEGNRKGRKEGVREGREQGRREERRNALDAFDRFIKEEREGEDDRGVDHRHLQQSNYLSAKLCTCFSCGRRKGPKSLPKLPLSAFTPPNSGTSEKFPLAPSPSTVHPEIVIDANVVALNDDSSLSRWKIEAGPHLGSRIGGIVVSMSSGNEESLSKLNVPVVSVMVPFSLDNSDRPTSLPTSYPVSLTTVFTGVTTNSVENLKWALQQGRPVDIDIHADLTDDVFESFEDLLSKSMADVSPIPPIIISNLLPPPNDLELPIVKLMNHPVYRKFQAQIAALSLFPQVSIKYLPPSWDVETPPTPSVMVASPIDDNKQKKEWKRRIKMYLGPVMEAFGYQRIIFGSSPSASCKISSKAGDWYEIARESFAELGVEQEAVDAVFWTTAKKIYA
ncbi:hypothetical protein F5876DRAFT_91051 [Lentinula aff. lateritia]|uniref:Uncharacterized protein n=1 Tax=Lentinula aff. lateritia TaxID=2804960 RepID=A0ACC1TPC6_9AGAR|nr:hypothetical protein F5876DRAFT_91051 [Lentinula aff. lateritia]